MAGIPAMLHLIKRNLKEEHILFKLIDIYFGSLYLSKRLRWREF